MARSSFGVPAGVLGIALCLLVAGCYGAYQVKADHPTGAGTLLPTVEDKDAGLGEGSQAARAFAGLYGAGKRGPRAIWSSPTCRPGAR